MKFAEMKQSPYLSWFDTTEEGKEVTIAGYDKVTIERQNGDAEVKYAVFFKEFEKGMILNATNRNKLTAIFGDDVEPSVGQKVILYYTDVQMPNGTPSKGLRVREIKKK